MRRKTVSLDVWTSREGGGERTSGDEKEMWRRSPFTGGRHVESVGTNVDTSEWSMDVFRMSHGP